MGKLDNILKGLAIAQSTLPIVTAVVDQSRSATKLTSDQAQVIRFWNSIQNPNSLVDDTELVDELLRVIHEENLKRIREISANSRRLPPTDTELRSVAHPMSKS